MNIVGLCGNLTRDPELTTSASGMAIAKCGVAWNQGVKQADGSYQDRAHFFDFTVFGRRAELFAAKAEKGDHVTIEGRLDFSSWETDGGEKRSKVGVVANVVEGAFQFRKSSGATASAPASTPAAPAGPPPDDDIPF